MKVALGVLSQSFGALAEFANTPMPPAQAVKIKKVLKAVKAELETFGEVEKKTAEEHKGVLKADDRGVQYYDFGSKENVAVYMEAMKEARAVEVEVAGDTWTMDDLIKVKEVKPAILDALDWLFPNLS